MDDKRGWREELFREYRETYRKLGKVSERLAKEKEGVIDLEYIGSMRLDVAWVLGRLRREERPTGVDELTVLSQRQRAVYLAYQGGLTYRQIGMLFSLSRGTVEHHLLRARQKLQDRLGKG